MQGTQYSKTILKKKNKVGELMPLNFVTYYKATIIKTECIGLRINI